MQNASLCLVRQLAAHKFGVPVYLSAVETDDDRFKIELGDEREHFGVFSSPQQAIAAIARWTLRTAA
jgi:hypothetical protein